ncbi:NADP(H)-dependent aldo-keto reductase [Thiomicrorhabdus sp. 6S3-12]|uniref:NADP(H)-dependent aldo-keto reductase n=1 Tax=Thiomicrorhabdus sp. 6S3-12 TaxID=2819681 RepID=UPI001AAC6136|nr:NADP(H)-dependent aldo-keto reductase [Thiomicrorhabdus sp. 6S3-12]MBO1923374.1 NADP(H)-dependent aldo-keto reductase [Thiomicrorhabdus sp. 6S3-12]
MRYTTLGTTDIKVSKICLGTMTWGEQNTRDEAFEQMNYALDQGVNFWDTAELYSVPPKAETYGSTETIIGEWFAKHGRRDEVVLASKIAGPGEFVEHIRGGKTRFNREMIEQALNASLKRLQTDYLDLYQLHWPERETNFFGQLGFAYPQETQNDLTPMAETLQALSEQVKAGKIRTIGLSNETAWGTMNFLHLAKSMGLEKVVTVQNPYNLLNRSYEVGLAEIAHQEQVGLLAYSPLAFGVLAGKYLNNQRPENARITLFPRFDRYLNPQADAATKAYVELAQQHGLSAAQMALSYINSRPFVTANIIGATTMEQLKENIESIDLELSDEVLAGIEQIHQRYTYPSP